MAARDSHAPLVVDVWVASLLQRIDRQLERLVGGRTQPWLHSSAARDPHEPPPTAVMMGESVRIQSSLSFSVWLRRGVELLVGGGCKTVLGRY